MRSFSSRCLSSCLDRLCGRLELPGPTCGPAGWPVSPGDTLRKVGVPSIVLTIGFRRPPRSNSCAEILRTGVVAPEPPVPPRPDDELPDAAPWLGLDSSTQLLDDDVGVACDTSHMSTVCRVAFLGEETLDVSEKDTRLWRRREHEFSLAFIFFSATMSLIIQ